MIAPSEQASTQAALVHCRQMAIWCAPPKGANSTCTRATDRLAYASLTMEQMVMQDRHPLHTLRLTLIRILSEAVFDSKSTFLQVGSVLAHVS